MSIDIEGERLSRFRELLSRLGVPFIRIPLQRERPDLYFQVDRHLNVAGHKAVAALVLKHIPE